MKNALPNWLALLLVAVAADALAQATAWPSKPINIIVSSTAGGPLDNTARMTGDWLQKRLGQTVVVENRPGGGTLIATEAVIRAPADGYILLAATSAFSTAHLFVKEARFHPVRDTTPIAFVQGAGSFLAVPSDRPYRTMSELMVWSKANPGKLNIGEAGAAAPEMEDLFLRLGLDAARVRYKGGPPMFAALLAGEIDLAQTNAQRVNGNPEKLRALVYTDQRRHPAVPQVLTIGETVLPGFYSRLWLGFLGPAGIPAPVVAKLNGEINEMLKQPEVIARIRAEGREPMPGDAAVLGREIEAAVKVGEALLARGVLKPQ